MTLVLNARCDLHVHSSFSTDSGNYALRRAGLGESYTDPARVYEVCRRRGMTFVTISDHNTVEGALRISDQPGAFLSVEVTTRFPEDELPLHVLVWNLSEEDHRDLQPYRSSVYELVAFLRSRGLDHGLAHPLYRMGPPLTVSHVEWLLLLFSVWEGRNGARSRESNEIACRLAEAATPGYLEGLAERHGVEPACEGPLALTAGSDDHGGLDIATTWTEAPGATPAEFLAEIRSGAAVLRGVHGSTAKLAHAVGALMINAYRQAGGQVPSLIDSQLSHLFDDDADDPAARHHEIAAVASTVARGLAAHARGGAIALDALPSLGSRVSRLLLAGAIEVPYLAALRHHAGTRVDLEHIKTGFFAPATQRATPKALVFTDTFDETNGVAGTMRRLAAEAAQRGLSLEVLTARPRAESSPGVIAFVPDWSLPLPGYETIELRFPSLTSVLARVEAEQPDVIHVATPGPVGLCGLASAKLLGLPLIGSYHTELGPYALHLTQDALVSDALELYVDWFYRQCGSVLAPTSTIADGLVGRGVAAEPAVWGRGVDTDLFAPERRSDDLRRRLLAGGDLLVLSVGRVSHEKRLHVLLEAFGSLSGELPGLRLAIAGDGPARAELEADAPRGVTFLGEVRGEALAELYASADLFCFTSTTDTFGQVLLEASASGLPVIAAAAGSAGELVEHERTGLLVLPDDPPALADAIARLARDDARRAAMAFAGRPLALTRTWQSSFDELQAAYMTAVGASSRVTIRAAA